MSDEPQTIEAPQAEAAPIAASQESQESDHELVLEDLLVEDVSIDGMCGVY